MDKILQEEDKLFSYEFGTVNAAMEEKVIMLVGATGAGKTTLINSLVNYIFNVQWNDRERYVLITESASHDQSNSQTQCVTSYTLHHHPGFNIPYTLSIIDTPGFGDTRGVQRDDEIMRQIKDYFTDTSGFKYVNSICFVITSSDVRLTATQCYIFNQILSIFGKDIASNICILFTFADSQTPMALKAIDALRLPYKYYFSVNSFCYNYLGEHSTPMETLWNIGMHSLAKFMSQLVTLQGVSLRLTKQVLEERSKIQLHILQVQMQITSALHKLRRMQLHITEILTIEEDFQTKRKL